MKISKLKYIIAFVILSSCGKDNLIVDYKSFLKQGEQVNLLTTKNLNNLEVSKISKINIKNTSYFNAWNFPNYNSQSLIKPSKIVINKKTSSISSNAKKILSYKDKIITINKNSEIIIFNENLKKILSKKIYKRKIYKNYNLNFKMIILDDKLFVSDNLGNIYSLNIETLEFLWELKLGVPFMSDMVIAKNSIYTINTNSKLFSIDLESGQINWSFETSSKLNKGLYSYQISTINNKLYFTNDSAEIYCIDLEKNNISWSLVFDLQNFQNTPLLFKSSPIVLDDQGFLYISTNFGFTYKINYNNGSIIWSVPIILDNRIFLAEKNLISFSKDSLVILEKNSGEILLNKKITFKDRKKKRNLTIKNILVGKESIYLFENSGDLITFDLKNLNDYNFYNISKGHLDYVFLNNRLFILNNHTIIKY